jgi:hypothetical protein
VNYAVAIYTSDVLVADAPGAWNALHGRAAESAQADFAIFQRRIHSLPRADGTWSDQILEDHLLRLISPSATGAGAGVASPIRIGRN